jgi:hypothetical protein
VRAASSLWEVIIKDNQIKKEKKNIKFQNNNSPIRVLISSSPFSCVLNINLITIQKMCDATGKKNKKIERRWDFFHLNTSGLSPSLLKKQNKMSTSSLAFAARPFERRWRSERRVPESLKRKEVSHTERERTQNCLFLLFFFFLQLSLNHRSK